MSDVKMKIRLLDRTQAAVQQALSAYLNHPVDVCIHIHPQHGDTAPLVEAARESGWRVEDVYDFLVAYGPSGTPVSGVRIYSAPLPPKVADPPAEQVPF